MMGDQEPDPIIKDLFKDVYNKEITQNDLNSYRNTKVNYENQNTQLLNLINNLELELD